MRLQGFHKNVWCVAKFTSNSVRSPDWARDWLCWNQDAGTVTIGAASFEVILKFAALATLFSVLARAQSQQPTPQQSNTVPLAGDAAIFKRAMTMYAARNYATALRAFEEAGSAPLCGVVSLGGTRPARDELRRAQTRLAGTMAFFPERWAEDLIPLARRILDKQPVLEATFVRYQMLTPNNVDLYYPLDGVQSQA